MLPSAPTFWTTKVTNSLLSSRSLPMEEYLAFFSQPRLRPYLQLTCGDLEKCLRLYHWNLEVSSAFQIPLHYCEIAIRNAVSDTFCRCENIGEHWPWNDRFLKSLDGDSRNQLRESRDKRDDRNTGRVVADLRFVFWERMFAKRHSSFWLNRIHWAFPNYTDSNADRLRQTLQTNIRKVRLFRNRIAHHEPVYQRELSRDMDRILGIVGGRSAAAFELLKSIETVSFVIGSQPKI